MLQEIYQRVDLKSQFNWTAECEAAFERMKNAQCSSPILSCHREYSSWTHTRVALE